MKVSITVLVDEDVRRDLLRCVAYRGSGCSMSSLTNDALRRFLARALVVEEMRRWPKEPPGHRPLGRPRSKRVSA